MANKTYQQLHETYKKTFEIVGNRKISPKKRLEALIATNKLFFESVEKLSPEEIVRMNTYYKLTEKNLRQNIELRWAESL